MVKTKHEKPDFNQLDPKRYIIIKGARVNNLKNIDVAIKRNTLTVVSGVSGSGKSSLAFDTLYAEGQRMYVESLSSYARQFLGRMEKPEVDYIRGISPAIAIDQRVISRNSRSTVGTSTEIYDYLKLLFARVGDTYSPISGKIVAKDTVTDVVDFVFSYPEGTRLMVLSPLSLLSGRTLKEELGLLLEKGFNRILVDGETVMIEEALEDLPSESTVEILVDRAVVKLDGDQPDEDTQYRISDSVQTAFFEGQGICKIVIKDAESDIEKSFSDKFELDGILFEEPTVNLFAFNNPYGACKTCEGFGNVLGVDPDLVLPDKNLSVFEGAIAPWRGERMGKEYLNPLIKNGIRFDFPIHRSIKDLNEAEYQLLWDGNEYFRGLNDFFKDLEEQTYKIQYRVMLSRYRGRTVCPECRGTKLRKDASYVKINGKSVVDLVLMPIEEVAEFFNALKLEPYKEKVARRILIEINNRLEYMQKVGLGYLTLNRLSRTLSGGESQRIRLATSLGSALVGSMYILDEPSIGLHPRDTQRLVSVLESLRNLGNTVIVVEHEEEVIKASDDLIDIGPDAGLLGGHLVYQGPWDVEDFQKYNSHTLNFLHGLESIPIPQNRRKFMDFITISGARENNLKDVDVKFPLGVLTVVTGVSGSGKSTLVRKILYLGLERLMGEMRTGEEPGKFDEITGSLSRVTQIEMVDQNPIGKSSRSNPVTYIKAYDTIRALMAEQPLAKHRDYRPAHFSFNVDGGRCEACLGEGYQTVEMQFMADVKLLCESCHGHRFKKEILEVTYHDKNISDILDMTVDEAIEFFTEEQPRLAEKLQPLRDVGLGYIKLGQGSNTLSGGEAQRVKLAFFLGKGNSEKGKTLFIFDEPTTGLHFSDIQKLLNSMNALIDQGDSIIVIEHNVEVIKSADWIIDLGPEGGDKGGYVCFEGTPEQMIRLDNNYTSHYLKAKFE